MICVLLQHNYLLITNYDIWQVSQPEPWGKVMGQWNVKCNIMWFTGLTNFMSEQNERIILLPTFENKSWRLPWTSEQTVPTQIIPAVNPSHINSLKQYDVMAWHFYTLLQLVQQLYMTLIPLSLLEFTTQNCLNIHCHFCILKCKCLMLWQQVTIINGIHFYQAFF